MIAAGVWTGVGFSNLKNCRTRIEKFWNRSGVGVWKSDSGHLCRTPATSNRTRSEFFSAAAGSGLDFVFAEKTSLVVCLNYIKPESNRSWISFSLVSNPEWILIQNLQNRIGSGIKKSESEHLWCAVTRCAQRDRPTNFNSLGNECSLVCRSVLFNRGSAEP